MNGYRNLNEMRIFNNLNHERILLEGDNLEINRNGVCMNTITNVLRLKTPTISPVNKEKRVVWAEWFESNKWKRSDDWEKDL